MRALPHTLTSPSGIHSPTANQACSSFKPTHTAYKPSLRYSDPYASLYLLPLRTSTKEQPTFSIPRCSCPLSCYHGRAHTSPPASIARLRPYRPCATEASFRLDRAMGRLVCSLYEMCRTMAAPPVQRLPRDTANTCTDRRSTTVRDMATSPAAWKWRPTSRRQDILTAGDRRPD